jgi:hypothetical protein
VVTGGDALDPECGTDRVAVEEAEGGTDRVAVEEAEGGAGTRFELQLAEIDSILRNPRVAQK